MPRTLERIHAPLTDIFPRADSGRERAAFRLSTERVEAFERDGFVSGIPLLSPEQVALLRERLTAIGERLDELAPDLYEVESSWLARPDEVVLHFLGAWRVDELLHDLVFHPGVTVPLAQLLETKSLRFWHDQVFWKPARHPGVVPWHQDYAYWTRTAPARHITMFIALDDMSPENGGLEYVPGSHRFGLLPPVDFGGPLDQIDEHLTAPQRAAFRPVPLRLTAGQAAIHHSHTMHGSRANHTDRPRRAIVLNYMAPDTICADGSRPLLAHTLPIEEGARVEGDCFPIVLA